MPYFRPDLFEDIKGIANRKGWEPTDVLREAWLADTILLLSKCMGRAVLTGGSGVRNITRIYRLTVDADFDTDESRIETIYEWMTAANKILGTKIALDSYGTIGMITTQPGRNTKAAFEGPNRLAPFVRWVDEKQFVRIHVMFVPDMPEMFEEYEETELETVVPAGAKVRTANRKHLFFRKATRALKVSRPEDFMDLIFILRAAGTSKEDIATYCAHPKRCEGAIRGLEILVSDRANFVQKVSERLVYAALPKPAAQWVEEAAQELDAFKCSIRERS